MSEVGDQSRGEDAVLLQRCREGECREGECREGECREGECREVLYLLIDGLSKLYRL